MSSMWNHQPCLCSLFQQILTFTLCFHLWWISLVNTFTACAFLAFQDAISNTAFMTVPSTLKCFIIVFSQQYTCLKFVKFCYSRMLALTHVIWFDLICIVFISFYGFSLGSLKTNTLSYPSMLSLAPVNSNTTMKPHTCTCSIHLISKMILLDRYHHPHFNKDEILTNSFAPISPTSSSFTTRSHDMYPGWL